EAPEIDALRCVQRAISDDLVRRCRIRARKRTTLKHSIEHFGEATVDRSTKRGAVWLEDVRDPELQSLATQQNQQATHTDLLQVFIGAQRVRVEHEKAAWLLSNDVDECVLKFETSFGLKRRFECDDTTQRAVRRCDPR